MVASDEYPHHGHFQPLVQIVCHSQAHMCPLLDGVPHDLCTYSKQCLLMQALSECTHGKTVEGEGGGPLCQNENSSRALASIGR